MSEANYLEQIAALIKLDPSITVRQIAQELKFADSKSVYYWLEKSNISGIKEFKRMVLGDKETQPSSFSFELEGKKLFIVRLPCFDWDPQQKTSGREWYCVHSHPRPRGLFAIRVGTDRYNPWFLQGDILIVSKEGKKDMPEGSWALLQSGSEFAIGKVLDRQVVDPATLKAYGSSHVGVGLIVHQERSLSP